MHDSAFRIGELVMQTYCDLPNARILEIGSMDVNGSLRDAAAPTTDYVGVDLEEGPSVDVVIKPGEKLPFDDASFDLIMASSAFEHDPRFWETFVEMCRVARPGGHIYVNAPSNGGVHRYPLDCWRFYPDAGLALVKYAVDCAINVELVESFVGKRQPDTWDGWNDFVAIFRRGPSKAPRNENFIYERYPSYNIRTWNSPTMKNETGLTEDMQLGRDYHQKVAEQTNEISELQKKRDEAESENDRLRTEAAHLQAALTNLEQQVQTLSNSLQTQTDTVSRLVSENIATKAIRDRLDAELRISQSEASQLRAATASLEHQVHVLSNSIQAQIEAFTRIRESDARAITELETDVARLRESKSRAISGLEADVAKLRADLQGIRTRAADLEGALAAKEAGHGRDRNAMEWLQALYIAMAGRPAWWSLLPAKSRRDREYGMLRRIGLFDDRAYYERYPDVAAAHLDALDHFIGHGLREGRDRI